MINKRLTIWLLTSAGFAAVLLLWHFSVGKAHSFLAIHNAFFVFPSVWKLITFLGDGFSVAILFPALWFWRSRQAAFSLLFAWLLGTAAVQGLKNTAYQNEARPIEWFEKVNQTPLIIPEGISMPYRNFSFPSGHTATAFSLWGVLLLFTQGPIWRIACSLVPVFVGLSRVVLMQHFPIDVCFGALIGMVSVLPALALYNRWMGVPGPLNK